VVTSTTTMNSTSDHTLYARWTANTYTVTFDTNITKYKNGDVVYFNPVTAKSCSASEAVSTTGTKDGCMKWYAFLDEGGDTVNLLLDHNTTAKIVWNSDGMATTPDTVNTQLQLDISNWNTNIKNSARLISAEEISQMVNFTTFTYYNKNEDLTTATEWNVNNSFAWHYFHTGNQTAYTGSVGTNQYAWLFDNLNGCEEYGCNISVSTGPSNYWTSSPTGVWGVPAAWYVEYTGSYQASTVTSECGIRPVITINKSLLNDSKSITYASKYGELPIPTRTGYNFLGWYTTGGVKVDSTITMNTASNHTLYAQWERMPTLITFKSPQATIWTIKNTENENEVYTWDSTIDDSYTISKPVGTYTFEYYNNSKKCTATETIVNEDNNTEVNVFCGIIQFTFTYDMDDYYTASSKPADEPISTFAYAEEGMTWAEWTKTEYDKWNYPDNPTSEMENNLCMEIHTATKKVSPTDVIIAGQTYYFIWD